MNEWMVGWMDRCIKYLTFLCIDNTIKCSLVFVHYFL